MIPWQTLAIISPFFLLSSLSFFPPLLLSSVLIPYFSPSFYLPLLGPSTSLSPPALSLSPFLSLPVERRVSLEYELDYSSVPPPPTTAPLPLPPIADLVFDKRLTAEG